MLPPQRKATGCWSQNNILFTPAGAELRSSSSSEIPPQPRPLSDCLLPPHHRQRFQHAGLASSTFAALCSSMCVFVDDCGIVHGYVWLSIIVDSCPWFWMAVYGCGCCVQLSMVVYGCPSCGRLSLVLDGGIWLWMLCTAVHGCIWLSIMWTVVIGSGWWYMAVDVVYSYPWLYMVVHHCGWFSVVLDECIWLWILCTAVHGCIWLSIMWMVVIGSGWWYMAVDVVYSCPWLYMVVHHCG